MRGESKHQPEEQARKMKDYFGLSLPLFYIIFSYNVSKLLCVPSTQAIRLGVSHCKTLLIVGQNFVNSQEREHKGSVLSPQVSPE